MKKMIFLLLACLLLTNIGWGQATNFQRAFIDSRTLSDTLGSDGVTGVYSESLFVFLPNNRGKGLLMAYFWFDSLGTATARQDCFSVFYRQAWGIDSAMVGTTGTPSASDLGFENSACWNNATYAPWNYVQIYNGPSGALANFDTLAWLMPRQIGGKVPIIFDMDGYPWRGLQLLLNWYGGEATDSVVYFIEFDID
jgi:hypothetical protein